MDDKFEVKIIEKPTLESLSDGEKSALCNALFWAIQEILKEHD